MGRDKASMIIGGRPLWRHVVDTVSTVSSPVILAPGAVGRLGVTGLMEAGDIDGERGPLGGIVAGLRASPRHLTAAVAVDMPCVSAGVLGLLRDLWDGEDAVVPVTTGREPLHAVYARSALPVLERCLVSGILSLREVLGRLHVREVRRDEWAGAAADDGFALNVNRPADLQHPRIVAVLDQLARNPDGVGERGARVDTSG